MDRPHAALAWWGVSGAGSLLATEAAAWQQWDHNHAWAGPFHTKQPAAVHQAGKD
jgi:hypothetical protein